MKPILLPIALAAALASSEKVCKDESSPTERATEARLEQPWIDSYRKEPAVPIAQPKASWNAILQGGNRREEKAGMVFETGRFRACVDHGRDSGGLSVNLGFKF